MSADKLSARELAQRLEDHAATHEIIFGKQFRSEEERQAAAELRRIPALEAERDQLRAEVEALRADAERYRWLRDQYLARHGLLQVMRCQPGRGEPCGDWWVLWPPYGIDCRNGPVGYAKTDEGAVDAARNNTDA